MKKILCGILGIALILSILTACGETENPTTATTTQSSITTTVDNSDFKKENLNDYIGYWFVDEQKTDFDKTNPENFADIDVIYISDVIEEEGNRAVAISIYSKDSGLVPYYYGFVDIVENSNYLRAPIDDDSKFHIEFKDGQIISVYLFEDGNQTIGLDETVFTYKTADDTAYEAILDYNTTIWGNRYIGYWYMYRIEGDTVSVDEIHIKEICENRITFDYSYGGEHGENVTADIRNGAAKFVMGDLIGVLEFYSNINLCVTDSGASGYAQTVGIFDNKSETPYVKREGNYNLNDYKGYWYTEDVEEDWRNNPGIGDNEMYIKEINGNKVTLGYSFAGVTADVVTVEVNDSIGVFDTVYMGEDGGKGIIRFDSDKIYLEVRGPENNITGLHDNFEYQRTYSLKGWEGVFN